MHLLATALVVLTLWTLLALPIAMFVGRFLQAGTGRRAVERNGRAPRDFGRAA